MSNINNALKIAVEVHDNQKNSKNGEEYILHPLRVMLKMEKNEEKIVAILHDCIEDSEDKDYIWEKIKSFNFSDEILEALYIITKQKKDFYIDYIRKIKFNKIATKVKLADLEDNLNILRLKKINQNDLKRIKKYFEAYNYLIQNIKEINDELE